MPEEIYPMSVNRIPGLKGLDQVTKNFWTVCGSGPLLGVRGVRPREDYSLLIGEVFPLVDQGASIMARTMQQNNQWRRFRGLQSLRHIKIVDPLLVIGRESFFLYLGLRRSGAVEKQDQEN